MPPVVVPRLLAALVALALLVGLAAPADAGRAPRPAAARATSIATSTARVAATARTAAPARRPGPLRRALRALGRTRVVATAGVTVGLPGLGATIEAGVLQRKRADARRAGAPRHALVGFGGVGAGPAGVRVSAGTDRDLLGYEVSMGPVSKKSAVYGDRVTVPIIPVFLSLSASRKGGLGLSIGGLPVPLVPYPLFRGEVSLYLDHPRLAPLATRILDTTDRIGARVARWTAPLRHRLAAATAPLRARLAATTAPLRARVVAAIAPLRAIFAQRAAANSSST